MIDGWVEGWDIWVVVVGLGRLGWVGMEMGMGNAISCFEGGGRCAGWIESSCRERGLDQAVNVVSYGGADPCS